MGYISILKQWVTRIRGGETVAEATGAGVGGATVTASFFQAPGEDSQPLPGDYMVTIGRGSRAAVVATKDAGVELKAQPGEVRRYARNEAGDPVVELWLRANGSAIISNSNGKITLDADGSIDINGAKISKDGQITDANGIKLHGHRHGGVQAGPSTTLGPMI